MAARTTDQNAPDDPVLGLIAKRKAEALARAEKEHAQLASAAKLWAQGTKTVTDAEEHLRKGREKQDSAVAAMVGAGMDTASVAETLGIPPKLVTEAIKRHRVATEGPAPEKPAPKAPARTARAKAADPSPPKSVEPIPKSVEPISRAAAEESPPAEPVAAEVTASTADAPPADEDAPADGAPAEGDTPEAAA